MNKAIINEYIVDPIYKVFFGVFSVFTIVLLSPILALAIVYVLFYNTDYLEYVNPDLRDLSTTEEGDPD